MYQTTITDKDEGQRFDKYLHRILPNADNGFLYKMLRKKNIMLNDKKAGGGERLACGDVVAIYFSDETLEKFTGKRFGHDEKPDGSRGGRQAAGQNSGAADTRNAARRVIVRDLRRDYVAVYEQIKGVEILYENEHLMLVDKPAGVLSQKASPSDLSLNEWLRGYLLATNAVTYEDIAYYKPSVCNRLDRNTSGIVLCAKTLKGARLLGELLKNRTLHKYYLLYVKGTVDKEQQIEGYLIKDEARNRVRISAEPPVSAGPEEVRASYIKTGYQPLKAERDKTLLEAELFTGRTHQIRAHLQSIGHPVLGDPKYGDPEWNEIYRRKYHVQAQLLHASRITFPALADDFGDISGRTFTAPMPKLFRLVGEE